MSVILKCVFGLEVVFSGGVADDDVASVLVRVGLSREMGRMCEGRQKARDAIATSGN